MIKKVCVYCASNRNTPEKLRNIARQVGTGLANREFGLVYGGASIGLMGEVADAVLSNNGVVTGVIPESLKLSEVAHHGLTELIVTSDMHERKMKMFELADAFVALPGSIGTLDELLEIMGWKYLGIHIKPILILNYDGFYDGLLSQFARCKKDGAMSDWADGAWSVVNSVDELLVTLDIAII